MNMYYKIILLVGVLVATGCAVSKNPLRQQVKLLQEGIIKDDTSYVYALPYEEGKTFRVIQGYFSRCGKGWCSSKSKRRWYAGWSEQKIPVTRK